MGKRFLIRYEGHLPKIAGKGEEWVECDSEITLGSLLLRISERFGPAAGGNTQGDGLNFLALRNGEFIPTATAEEVWLQDGDVVTLIPPVAGG